MSQPVFRFAPSPNGALHLGHAYSALKNLEMARARGGRCLLRIEDIDTRRCSLELEAAMLRDLEWVGFEWDAPPMRQSSRFDRYQEALKQLQDQDLIYQALLPRGEVKTIAASHEERTGQAWPRDPDGALLYPETDRSPVELVGPISGPVRLNMQSALDQLGDKKLHWQEGGSGPGGETGSIIADPARWGDFLVSRKDTPTSYHLAVVVDDFDQAITHVVRGQDLFYATSAHRLLQALLGFDAPEYHHHGLVLDSEGRKLSKSNRDTSLQDLRKNGKTPEDIRRMIGL